MSVSARIRYAHSAVDDVASLLAATHPRACQYLEQAPLLAVVTCEKLGSHITYGELDRFGGKVATEPRLRDLLADYAVAAPLRKIVPAALRPGDRAVFAELGRLDVSTLSQAVPVDSQRVWLDGIKTWMRLAPREKRARSHWNVAWIARRLSEDLSRYEQVEALVDYLGRGGGALNDRWTWARALEQVEAWHRELRDEAALRRLIADREQAATFDNVICKAPLPDEATVEGYTFRALRTMRRLREEGTTMHHCVASYAGEVKRGHCAIVSVARDGVGIATLQLSSAGTVAQLKGHCNQSPAPAVRRACELYALLNWRPAEKAA